MNYIMNAIRGFCMALADSVPGVSGGTIAFILGIYDKFIMSLNDVIYGNKKEKREAIFFLLKLGIGWVIGMILAVLILSNLFQTQIYKVSSVFIGLIIFSIPLIIKTEKEFLKGKYRNLIFTVIGIAIVALITYFNPIAGQENVVDISHLNFGLGIYIFVVAMVAISAMVLPGISGSTLLLIFGLYIPIISAIKSVLTLNFTYLPSLIVFAFGVLAGIILVIKLIKIALEKYRSQTIYCIIGLMIGSIYAIVMGPTTLEIPQAPMGFSEFNILFFVIGGIIVWGLEKTRQWMENKKIEEKETQK